MFCQALALTIMCNPKVSSEVQRSAFQLGKTKVFMQADAPFFLERIKKMLLYVSNCGF
jgi:myosin heavy subunit